MKKLLWIIPVVCLAILGCGCKTVTNTDANGVTTSKSTLDPDKVANAVEVGAQLGAKAAIAKDPNARPYFVAVETAVSALINNGQYDSVALCDSLNKISVNEIKNSEEVKSSIQSIIALYSVFEGEAVSNQVNKNLYLAKCLRALDTGLKSALAATAPAPSPQ